MENKWTVYNKVFTIKNTYCKEGIESAVDGINAEIKAEGGTFISTELVGIYQKVNNIDFYENEEDGSRTIYFNHNTKVILSIHIDEFDEITFDFEIEENLNTDIKVYHGCLITGINYTA